MQRSCHETSGVPCLILQDIISFTNINRVSAGDRPEPMIFRSRRPLANPPPITRSYWSRRPLSHISFNRRRNDDRPNWRRPLKVHHASAAVQAHIQSCVKWVSWIVLGEGMKGRAGAAVRSVSLSCQSREEVSCVHCDWLSGWGGIFSFHLGPLSAPTQLGFQRAKTLVIMISRSW